VTPPGFSEFVENAVDPSITCRTPEGDDTGSRRSQHIRSDEASETTHTAGHEIRPGVPVGGLVRNILFPDRDEAGAIGIADMGFARRSLGIQEPVQFLNRHFIHLDEPGPEEGLFQGTGAEHAAES